MAKMRTILSLRIPLWRGIGCGLAFTLAGCDDDSAALESLRMAVIETYASIAHASYEDSFRAAEALDDAIQALVASPTEETLRSVRAAWLAAREPYGQTEAFRFYGGPIDRVGGPETLLNAWPLDEGYVDYVRGAPESGIINQPEAYPVVDRELLTSLNEAGAEENISTGFHAIEFLLWGQDLSPSGPGERSHTDYVTGEGPNAERRAQYLSVVSALLVEQLEGLVTEWAPGEAANYRASLSALESGEAVRRILVGIGVLSKSELAGERMFTPYDNQDQEDEHSCFSDNTHRDILANWSGIRNVLDGRYLRTEGTVIEGPGMLALIERVDPELSAEMHTLANGAADAIERISVPFDRAIVDPASRPLVLLAIYLLQDLGDRIAEAGTVMGITINTALPG